MNYPLTAFILLIIAIILGIAYVILRDRQEFSDGYQDALSSQAMRKSDTDKLKG